MAWTITYTKPLNDQVVDVNGMVEVKCDVGVDGEDEPVVKAHVYDESDTPGADPPPSATILYVENSGGSTYACTADVDVNKAGGSTKPTLTKLTLRVWAGTEEPGGFNTRKIRDRKIWGFNSTPAP